MGKLKNMLTTIQPCPFCGSEESFIDKVCGAKSIHLQGIDYFVTCANCEANGPPSNDRTSSVFYWNTRKDHP